MLQCYYSIQEMHLLMDFLWFLVIPDKKLAVPLHTASFLLQILKWEDILRREKLDFSQSSPPIFPISITCTFVQLLPSCFSLDDL